MNFGVNSSNPFDTGHSYANALAGRFNSYSEMNFRDQEATREWYVQDNWRVTSRLTLDIGLRMSYLDAGARSHAKAVYDDARRLRRRARCRRCTGRRATPRDGGWRRTRAPAHSRAAPLIGLFVPGSGDPFYGIVEGGTNGLSESMKDLYNPGLGSPLRFRV